MNQSTNWNNTGMDTSQGSNRMDTEEAYNSNTNSMDRENRPDLDAYRNRAEENAMRGINRIERGLEEAEGGSAEYIRGMGGRDYREYMGKEDCWGSEDCNTAGNMMPIDKAVMADQAAAERMRSMEHITNQNTNRNIGNRFDNGTDMGNRAVETERAGRIVMDQECTECEEMEVFQYERLNRSQQPAQTEPVRQPVRMEPIQQPVRQTPVQQPVRTEPIRQPIQAAPIQQPVRTEPIRQPIQAAPVQQPVRTEPIRQPIQAAPVQQPVRTEPIRQPIQAAPIQQPVRQTPVQQPVRTEPIQAAPIQQPVRQTPIQQPVRTEPVRTEPVQPVPIKQPIQQAPVRQEPVRQPAETLQTGTEAGQGGNMNWQVSESQDAIQYDTMPEMPAPIRDQQLYDSFQGTVTSVRHFCDSNQRIMEGHYLMEVQDDDGDLATFYLSPDTYYADCNLRAGDQVIGFYRMDLPMIMIFPPRYTIRALARVNAGRNVKADYFDEELISSDGMLKLNLADETFLMNENGRPYNRNIENKDLFVIYGASTRSIPAAAVPSVIVVLEEGC